MLNMNFQQKLVIDTSAMAWQASPATGVMRKPLEREAKESGHTTSIVEYAPGSRFASHPHPLGEEILVLEGVFSDETGDFPAGSYIRNPPGSRHAPFSEPGCLLFVKLNQFEASDNQQVRIDTRQQGWLPEVDGMEAMPLHQFGHEHVSLIRWNSGQHKQQHKAFGGEEILVLSGALQDEHRHYPKHSWLRYPHLSPHSLSAQSGTVCWVKTGHLPLPL